MPIKTSVTFSSKGTVFSAKVQNARYSVEKWLQTLGNYTLQKHAKILMAR